MRSVNSWSVMFFGRRFPQIVGIFPAEKTPVIDDVTRRAASLRSNVSRRSIPGGAGQAAK